MEMVRAEKDTRELQTAESGVSVSNLTGDAESVAGLAGPQSLSPAGRRQMGAPPV